MPSPFPGMDPYLEGYLWPDVHSALAHKIRLQLAPQIQPNYVARLEISVVEDTTFQADVGLMYPDVEIIQPKSPPLPTVGFGSAVAVAVASPTITAPPLTMKIPKVRLLSVEVRDVAANQLVTSIEILSPVNKREPNLSRYRKKRDRLRQADIHLLEIDLLRRGRRVWFHQRVSEADYVIALTRAGDDRLSLWPLQLAEPLPVLPVPLRAPDADVVLNLPLILNEVYDEAFYHLSIDYQQAPPPPALSDAEAAWLQQKLEAAQE